MFANDSKNYPLSESHDSEASYHLKLVLPKFLLPGLIQEWKVSYMMTEDISKYGKIRVNRSHFAVVGLEGSSESLESGRRRELGDFEDDLL